MPLSDTALRTIKAGEKDIRMTDERGALSARQSHWRQAVGGLAIASLANKKRCLLAHMACSFQVSLPRPSGHRVDPVINLTSGHPADGFWLLPGGMVWGAGNSGHTAGAWR
jgi:hypothetical protein